ncbi:hypothetical protein LXL04_031282 [Taraxacum kok-saghyz]
MEEGARGRGGSDGASSALLHGGGRQRFQLELSPGETTIVSWKKLMKDANKAASNSLPPPPPVPAPPMPPAVAVNQALDHLNAAPGKPTENEAHDAAHGSRFGAVIEKIERLYMGKNSSDEEDLNDVVPDDDEYDTEDSFIDDTELNDYFQVDNSQIKHDGFFVNRGKLERKRVSKNESVDLSNHQPKKRRKDSEKVTENITNSRSNSGLLINKSEELNQSPPMKEKNMNREKLKANVSGTTQQAMVRKEGSNTKSKSALLEKAIKDLEKIVVESRPPGTGVADADTSSSAVKKRMPPEIKHKLAKVARLAHAIHGKISKELLNRLMSIVGHLIQLRSLRRNLVNMVNMGLSAKEEKDTRMQQLKKQIEEMVKIRAPMMMSKAMEQQLVGESDDFQESGTKEKEILKRRITIDDTLEDKICVLYDLFVEGLDEDAGPQVRKLYAELAEMWPKGLMDNHGIRGAICRAKDRRKALHRHNNKGEDKLKGKKN